MARLTTGNRVISFIETHCVFTTGSWRGKPFRLLPWQKSLLLSLFEVFPDTLLRKYLWALIGTPKKNGKTELVAALALYFLLGDGELDPQIAVAASAEEQANILFNAARTMAELSPTLSQLTERFDKEIYSKLPQGGRMVRVAAAVGSNDGPSWSVVICDELHEWTGPKGRGVWNTLTNGTIARKQPMVLQITTAGVDRDTVCYEQYEYGLKVQSGEIDDPRFFFTWFGVPDESDWRNPEVWKAANPSYGVAVNEAAIRDQMNRKPEGVFRRYFLNQWTEATVLWLPSGAWEALTVPGLELDSESTTWVAIDAATRYDSTAVLAGQWQDGKLCVNSRIWERPIDIATGKPSESWRLPMAELAEHVRDLHIAYNVAAIAYDPAYITMLAQELSGDGLPMEEFPQTTSRMAPASQALYELIVSQRLSHPGDSALTRHIKAAAAEATGNGNGAWRLVKSKARRKMDGAIALAMVAALATQAEEKQAAPNIWTFTDEELKEALAA